MNSSNVALFFLRRKWIILSLCLVTPFGFLCKWYSGPVHTWFNNYGGGVAYEVFWCLVLFFFKPNKKHTTAIAISVFLVTVILEVLQLWQLVFLQELRSFFWGRTILGTTFVWWDFPHYVLGCLLGWLWMRVISKGLVNSANSPGNQKG